MSQSSMGSTYFRPFLRRVSLRNFKSVGACSVELAPLTLIVGRNGSGKSNFLDALRFVSEALRSSLGQSIRRRGGLDEIVRRSTGHPRNIAIDLELSLPDWLIARYGFELVSREGGSFYVKTERLRILNKAGHVECHFHREDESIEGASRTEMPPVAADRLYLVTAAALPEFRATWDALVATGFYNLQPDAIRELQIPDGGELLDRDGSNLASVIGRLETSHPEVLERILETLQAIQPDISRIERVTLGPRETLQLGLKVLGSHHPWKFYASSVSDGTLRALGALVAISQVMVPGDPVRLVGLEEPEIALHPAAAGAFLHALRRASRHTQILLTSHSTELLDRVDPEADGLLVVDAREGTSEVAPADPESLAAVREGLHTPGELLRLGRLYPNAEHVREQEQLDLFEPEG